jgi:hypothetical protein
VNVLINKKLRGKIKIEKELYGTRETHRYNIDKRILRYYAG